MPVSGSLTHKGHKGNRSGTQKTEPDPPTADKPTHGTRHSLQTKKNNGIFSSGFPHILIKTKGYFT